MVWNTNMAMHCFIVLGSNSMAAMTSCENTPYKIQYWCSIKTDHPQNLTIEKMHTSINQTFLHQKLVPTPLKVSGVAREWQWWKAKHFYFGLEVAHYCKHSNVTKNEIFVRRQKRTTYVKQIRLLRVYVKFRIEEHCLMKKRCIIKNIFYQYLKCHAWRNLNWPTVSFLWMYGFFPSC